jgi:hypothetical protein
MGRGRRQAVVWSALAFVALVARAQDQPRPADPGLGGGAGALENQDPVAEKPKAPIDPSRRYLFREMATLRRGVSETAIDPSAPQPKSDTASFPTYLVGFRETETETIENAQAAPVSTEVVRQARFLERIVKTNIADPRRAASLVRRFEVARVVPDNLSKPGLPPLLDNLQVLLLVRRLGLREVVVLTPDRSLYEHEYGFIQNQLIMHDLATLLPIAAVRVGQAFRIDPGPASLLVNSEVQRSALEGRLVEVEPASSPDQLSTAVFDIGGHVQIELGDMAVNARMLFKFNLPQAQRPGDDEVKKEDEVGARTPSVSVANCVGAITKISLAQVVTERKEGAGDRTLKRELIMERRPPPQGASIDLPTEETKITLTPANTYVTFIDPDSRFAVRHPQDFQLDLKRMPETLTLVRHRPAGPDVLTLEFHAGEVVKPETVFPALFNEFADRGIEVTPGPVETLPAAEWPNRTVHRTAARAEVKNTRNGRIGTITIDGYVVQFTRNASLVVQSMTMVDPQAPMQEQFEEILKTFTLDPTGAPIGPAADPAAAPATTPDPAKPPATTPGP